MKSPHMYHYFIQQNIRMQTLASALLLILVALLVPQHSIGATAMLFPTNTAYQASFLFLNKNEDLYVPARTTTQIVVTSYNSEPGQTDSTPFITAFGTEVRDGIVATNYLPKGTQVRFPDLFGDKVFVVEDRMNIRYNKRMDIWSADKEFSRNFGARYLRMEIL